MCSYKNLYDKSNEIDSVKIFVTLIFLFTNLAKFYLHYKSLLAVI